MRRREFIPARVVGLASLNCSTPIFGIKKELRRDIPLTSGMGAKKKKGGSKRK